MGLRKQGDRWHAERADDLDEYLLKVTARNKRGMIPHVIHAKCACGGSVFTTFTDDAERLLRVCSACEAEHAVCDLDEVFDLDSASEIVCECMWGECEIAVGFCFSESVQRKPRSGKRSTMLMKYLYVATRCTDCGRCAVCAEWDTRMTFPASAWFESV